MVVIHKNKTIRKKGWAQVLSASGIAAWDLNLYYRKELADKGYDVNWSDIEWIVSDSLQRDLGRSAQKVVFEGVSYRVFSFRVLGFVAFSVSAGKSKTAELTKPRVVGAQNRGLVCRSRIFTALPD